MYLDAPIEGFPSKIKANKKNEWKLQATLTQAVFNATVFTAIRAAEEFEKLTDYTYDANVVGVITAAKKAFFQTALLKKVWFVKKETKLNAKENYELVKNKFDNGLISKLELLQAEVRYKSSIPETTEAERNYKLALNTIKNLAGIKVTENIVLNADLETIPLKPEDAELSEVVKRRPDLNAMVWENNLRKTNVDVEYSAHFPTVYASLAYVFQSQTDKMNFDNQNNLLVAGLTVKIPIFSGMATTAKVQKAQIEADQSALKIEQHKEKIENELLNLKIKLEESSFRIKSARTTLETAETAFKVASKSSANGVATQLQLKDARVQLDQAKLGYYSAVFEFVTTCIDWELAAGLVQK
ncbi:MAG: TolC family protein, partial [Rhodothermaceae bacterium]